MTPSFGRTGESDRRSRAATSSPRFGPGRSTVQSEAVVRGSQGQT